MEILAIDFAGMLGTVWNILCVALGLGLVIFFHELGHFAVAKWCNVQVERFSIGFGPILWSRQKGETEYALSAVPFGGYVKMLGQDDMDPNQMADEQIAENPRAYSAKKVWQRMAIISAGVIMNVFTAWLFFAGAFWLGVYTPPATVGVSIAGSPAWEQGLRLGDRITSINGEKVTDFQDVAMSAALSSGDLEIEGVHSNGEAFKVVVAPDATGNIPIIGVFPTQNNRVIEPIKKDDPITSLGLPAHEADPPFEPGDVIQGIGGTPIEDFATIKDVLARRRSESLEFELKRNDEAGTVVTTTVAPMKLRKLGFYMDAGPIVGIQQGSPAAGQFQVDDKIQTVDGKHVGREIDPLRLPDYLAAKHGKEVVIVVRRKATGGGDEDVTLKLVPNDLPGWLDPPGPNEPLSVPAIGICFNVLTRIAHVLPESEAARHGIKKGQKIVKLELIRDKDGPKDGGIKDVMEVKLEGGKDIPEANWAAAFWGIQMVPSRQIKLYVSDGEKETPYTLEDQVKESDWYLPIRGFKTEPQREKVVASGIGEALGMGYKNTKKTALNIYLTLRALIMGRVSPKELHGPLGIATVGYKVAKEGPPELLMFLGFLSVNLAVLNFLPIPLLDGGHMVFLIWEAVTGKKPGQKVLIVAQYAGLIFILSLMIFVIGIDVRRIFF